MIPENTGDELEGEEGQNGKWGKEERDLKIV